MNEHDFLKLPAGTRLRTVAYGSQRVVGVDRVIFDPATGKKTGDQDRFHSHLYVLDDVQDERKAASYNDRAVLGHGSQVPPAALTNVPRNMRPGDWLNGRTSSQRKDIPMARGLLDYFPDALAAIARHSKQGNDKHNPGQPLHWSREKSSDHADCILRHLAGRGGRDSADGSRHSIGLAWRALALLQLEIEEAQRKGEEV
jgi:hypothetical protein